MKKRFTMLLTLAFCLFTSSVMAQTYYTPGARTTTLKAGEKYFISAATFYNGARPNLLYNDKGTLAYSDLLPKVTVTDESYLFTVEEVGENNVYYVKNNEDKYLQANTLASTDAKTGMNIVSYHTAKGSISCGNDVQACDAQGQKIEYNEITDGTPIVCVYYDEKTGWRHINGLQTGKSTPFAFYEVIESDAPFEVTTDVNSPIYYTIKNIRGNVYARYDGTTQSIKLRNAIEGSRCMFYFTAGETAGTYKIHNAVTDKKCAATNSWTDDGIDWYIKKSGNTSYSGLAIANQETLTDDGETDEAWNDSRNEHTSVAGYGGNDAGSVWAIEKWEGDVPAIKLSTEGNIVLHYIRSNRRTSYVNFDGHNSTFKEGGLGLSSYWYFVQDEEAQANAPEGFIACRIFNAAHATGVENHSSGFMGTDAWPARVYYIGAKEINNYGYIIRRTDVESDGWHDYSGTYVGDFSLDDDGSLWSIYPADKTVDQLKTEAAAAKTDALAYIADAEMADYFTYADEAIATAKEVVEAVNTDDLVSAVSGHIAINAAMATLKASERGTAVPVAGEYIQLKNKNYGTYLEANGSGLNGTDKDGLSTFWAVEAGDDANVKLRNLSTGQYIGVIRQGTAVSMVDGGSEKQFAWKNQTDVYGVFKETTGANYAHGHINGSNVLVGWEPSAGATQWVVARAYPLTVKYEFKGKELENCRVETYVRSGGTYTVMNPYPYKYVTVGSCKVGETPLEAVDGNWTVTVTEPATVTVTLEECLPFKTSTDEKFLIWHYLQVNSSSWKYVTKTDGGTSSTTSVEQLDDKAQWAFVGDAINGFKILNKDTDYLNYSLSVDATTNGTAAYMKQEEKTWQIERGNGGFVIRQGEEECLNDFGGAGVLKVWNNADAPAGNGSAFRALEFGVADLSELVNPMSMSVYALQAERSPLMYSTAETTKLSSGLFEQLSENANDVNQQFVILRTQATPEGYFYLYSVGAKKFVDENLNFTDYPSPVLSFESSNHKVYPWWVKIDGKYVIPANNGTDGNKLYHIEGGADDDGKRYRIVYVGSYSDYGLLTDIEQAEDMIKDASELSNEKVYTVSTYDRGYWYYNTEAGSALWSTAKAGVEEVSSSDANVQFAFLTVADHTYLYSIGAQQFVVMSEPDAKGQTYTTYSEEPTQGVELLAATGNRFYPFVAAFVNGESRHHIGISNTYEPPVISFYNDLGDGGNKIKIREVTAGYMADGAAELLANAVATIDSYLAAHELKPELLALINRANELLGFGYLDAEDTGALTNAKTTAQGVYDNDAATSGQLTEQVELLTEAITAVTYVREVADFKNAYVYTFVSKRGWMGADGTDGVISGTGAADNTNYQWAVYKSERGYSYLYNIGKAQFMGVETQNNAQMPFSATPQTTGLTFKKSAWTDYPIMFSMDNQYVVNNNKAGQMICWTGGWNNLEDDGSNHQVAIVGALAEETLTTIAAAVATYEERTDVIQELGDYLDEFYANYYDAWGSGWRNQAGVNNYSQPEGDQALNEAYEDARTFYEGITDETAVADITAKKTYLEGLEANLTINQPEEGKFYRLRCVGNGRGYLQCTQTVSAERFDVIAGDAGKTANAAFCYYNGGLLAYANPQYINHDSNKATYKATVTLVRFEAAGDGAVGQYNIKVGDRYLYGQTDRSDSGTSNSTTMTDTDAGYHWWLEEVTTLPVAVSAAGYATLYAPVNLQIPAEGVTVYTAEVTDTYVSLIELEGNVIPANTGVMLKAEESSYDFTVVADAPDDITSDFVGACPKSEMKDGVKTYTLQKPAGGEVGFYRFKGTQPINGFRAWVELPSESNAQALRIRFGRGEGTTAIDELEATANGQQPTAVYDLAGRRVLNPAKGMYIVNGKKVVIK